MLSIGYGKARRRFDCASIIQCVEVELDLNNASHLSINRGPNFDNDSAHQAIRPTYLVQMVSHCLYKSSIYCSHVGYHFRLGSGFASTGFVGSGDCRILSMG
jgi:hypothetical protein